MSVATVYLVGIDQLPDIPDYLDLGAVVVIAPDRGTLRTWQREQQPFRSEAHPARADGLVVDLARRSVSFGGTPVNLSDREFSVLSALTSPPRRAWSFRELLRRGWGDQAELPVDIYALRALIQRIRLKLRAADVPIRIEAVRGFGYRAEARAVDTGPVIGLARSAG